MNGRILYKFFEHNNWANSNIIRACLTLSDDQLDIEPVSATKGSIRLTLWHLIASQQGYLSLLTGSDPGNNWQAPPPIHEMQDASTETGEALLALANDEETKLLKTKIQTKDGYFVAPWVVMLQVINHATEHREQIKSMLSSQGLAPPELDGWTYGEVSNALTPIKP